MRCGGFTHWDHSTQDVISSFMALTNGAERTLDLPRHGAVRACPWLLTEFVAKSVRRGSGEDRYSQRRHPRLSKGGQGEVVRRRFSIVGTCSLGSLLKKPWDRTLKPQYWFNKTKQHTHTLVSSRQCSSHVWDEILFGNAPSGWALYDSLTADHRPAH